MRESADSFVQSGSERLDCQTLEGLHQRVTEAVQSVAVTDNALALDVIQHFAHLPRGILMMVQKRNEIRDGALEVNVVLPERVIGIDEQRLGAIGILHNLT